MINNKLKISQFGDIAKINFIYLQQITQTGMFYFYYNPYQLPFSYNPHSNSSFSENQLVNPYLSNSQTEKQSTFLEVFQKIILAKEDLEQAGYGRNKRFWTEKQDQLLIFFRQKKKMSWCQIQKKIPGRNKKMCYSRYKRLKCTTKMFWFKKHDDKLLKLVQQHGQNWEQIRLHFKRRNIRQIKEHYFCFLRPGIIDCQWSLQDDLKLIASLNEHGKDWKVISDIFKERSLSQIKNRYYGRIRNLNDKKLGLLSSANVIL